MPNLRQGNAPWIAVLKGQIRRLDLALVIVLVLGGSLYLARAVLDRADTIDFKYIWLAGDLWLAKLDPYSDIYVSIGQVMFAGKNAPSWWPYPPNWWPVATVTALLPYSLSEAIWRGISGLWLVLGCGVLWKGIVKAGMAPTRLQLALFFLLTVASTNTAIAIFLGQTSCLIFLGVACFSVAWMRRSSTLMVIALVLLMLKPTVVIVLIAALLARRAWWASVMVAGIISLIMALPAICRDGPIHILHAYLDLLGRYGLTPVNGPASMTGLRNLVNAVFEIDVSAILLTLTGACAAFLVSRIWRDVQDHAQRATLLGAILSIGIFFVPMHTYDLIIVTPLLLLVSKWQRRLIGFVGLAELVLFRVKNVADVTGFMLPGENHSPGSLIASLVTLGLMFAFVAALGRPRRRLALPCPTDVRRGALT